MCVGIRVGFLLSAAFEIPTKLTIEITKADGSIIREDGPYGEEGTIIQALHPLPVFDNNHTVIGSWLVASNACGIGIREDDTAITKDTSRFLPHVILD